MDLLDLGGNDLGGNDLGYSNSKPGNGNFLLESKGSAGIDAFDDI